MSIAQATATGDPNTIERLDVVPVVDHIGSIVLLFEEEESNSDHEAAADDDGNESGAAAVAAGGSAVTPHDHGLSLNLVDRPT
ncbi:MAG: hypothetical protein OXF27_21535 [Acidobacteria bacterium]|nr:hypothetical protein [Acidobacteriota bacterium]